MNYDWMTEPKNIKTVYYENKIIFNIIVIAAFNYCMFLATG